MRLILSLIIPILLCVSVTAQDKRPSPDEIEAIKTAWMAKKLSLTPEEAQLFWPVYNKYESEMKNLYTQKRKNWGHENTNSPQEILKADLELDGKILYTKRRYQAEFQRIIPAQKVLALYRAEPEFREHLMRQLRSRSDHDKKDNNR